jgi:hypothetical protein
MTLENQIKQEVLQSGFDAVGITEKALFGCSLLIMQLQTRPSDSENLKNRRWRYRPGIFFYRKFLHPISLPEIRAADSETPFLPGKRRFSTRCWPSKYDSPTRN